MVAITEAQTHGNELKTTCVVVTYQIGNNTTIVVLDWEHILGNYGVIISPLSKTNCFLSIVALIVLNVCVCVWHIYRDVYPPIGRTVFRK